ncbi:MAG: SDR family oxidoreductase [Acidobacteria bacterium]|nr:SDR family oxidoreductase [Acidobacteriota bacterium]
MAQELSGKAALVTGGAQRIGRAIALALARGGADIAITYLESERAAQRLAAEIEQLGRACAVFKCDVREQRSVEAMVRRVEARFGGVDLLVNNAGWYETVALADITPQQWDRALHINTRGPFLVARALVPALTRRRGRIINLGSLGGARPWVMHAQYCASKAALNMLTLIMAKALAPRVSVNCVAPGMIETRGKAGSALLGKIAAKTPMKRNGTPEEVAEAVLFFATATPFITGQVLYVDGGLALAT